MYSIIELQTTDNATAHLCYTAESKNEAMSIYHTILASAAKSSMEYHTCIVVDPEGLFLARECYKHPKEEQEEEIVEE